MRKHVGTLAVIGIVVGLVAIAATVGRGALVQVIPRGVQAESHGAAVGEPVQASGNRTYQVTAVEDFKVALIYDWSVGDGFAERGMWIVVDVELDNRRSNQAATMQADDFELSDNSGRRYGVSSSPVVSAYNAQLQDYYRGHWVPLGSQIPFGLVARTTLVFDVMPDAAGLKLDIKPAGTTVDLERPHRIPITETPGQGRR